MRPSLYAPLSLLACTALALSACKPGQEETGQRAQAAAVSANAAASAASAKQASPAAAAAIPAGDDNLNAVLWMQRSEEYRAVAEQTYRAAATSWMPRSSSPTGTRWCRKSAATPPPA